MQVYGRIPVRESSVPNTLRLSKPFKLNAGSLSRLRCFEPVQAGFPSPAEDYKEKPFDLNKILL